jgi:hypothetical protein
MPLTSKLFAGDKALEACLVSDPAHVVPGASGPHVGKIQSALITLGEGVIDRDDISAMRYGASTANAVLAFKTKRGIINRAYQSKPDNIVGKMTIAALDREIATHEQPLPGCPTCQFGTLTFVPPVTPPAPAPPVLMLPSQVAMTRLGDARLWTTLATAWLDYLMALAWPARMAAPSVTQWNFAGVDQEVLSAIKTHFKAHLAADTLLHLRKIRNVFGRIQSVLANAETFFADDLVKVDFAYAFPGALDLDASHPHRHLFFCWPFISQDGVTANGPLFQTMVIIHEGAHFVERRVGHSASELPAPNGTPINTTGNFSGHNYASMTDHDAFTNAYSYAQFALHAVERRDRRITPFHE